MLCIYTRRQLKLNQDEEIKHYIFNILGRYFGCIEALQFLLKPIRCIAYLSASQNQHTPHVSCSSAELVTPSYFCSFAKSVRLIVFYPPYNLSILLITCLSTQQNLYSPNSLSFIIKVCLFAKQHAIPPFSLLIRLIVLHPSNSLSIHLIAWLFA